MDVGENSVIYVGLIPGSNKTDEICRKIMVMGMMQRGFTVYLCILEVKEVVYFLLPCTI
jgi:hypothetical protein